MTVFIFEKEIDVSRNFSIKFPCVQLFWFVGWLMFWWNSNTGQFLLIFCRSQFQQELCLQLVFCLVPRCSFIKVIAPSSNCCLKTVNQLERLEIFSDWRTLLFLLLKVSQLHMVFKEETFVMKVWSYLYCYCSCWFQNYQKGSLYETSNGMFSQRFECQFQLGCFYVLWLMLLQRRWTPISEMNKEQFLHYLKKDKNKGWRNNRHKSCLLHYERNHEYWVEVCCKRNQ